MKLLVLPRYGRLGASSRLRLLQYLPILIKAGFEVSTSPLFLDNYVSDLQNNKRNFVNVLKSYAERFKSVLASKTFDLIWIEKELLPWLPSWVEQMILSSRIPYVLDYDDAVFHYYDLHRSAAVRLLLADKHPSLIKGSAAVIAGNKYLADYAKLSGARYVEILPTVIDLDRYPQDCVSKRSNDKLQPLVGWIGQRSTSSLLMPYKDIFEELTRAGKARFAAIGINAQSLDLPMESIFWTEQSEVASIKSFDIGIMPLADEPFERGKCGYKLIQYMACGLPTIASPVGVNQNIVEHGVTGLLAGTPDEWAKSLEILLQDFDMRIQMGQAGRHKVELEYCIQKTGPRLINLLKNVVQNK